ncbi:MAG: hypothetical protein ACREGE_02030 [Candidatus Microsaccharimonas sp.]
METPRYSMHDWVVAQVGDKRPRSTDADGSKAGNLGPFTTTQDLELVINNGVKGHEPKVIFVPKGSELVVFRHPAHTAPNDTVATLFVANKYQASLRGNRRVVMRRY